MYTPIMDHENKPQIQFSYYLVHNNFYNLKRTLVFLVTVTVFSFFLCLSSGFSVLPNSYYLYFNSCLFSFLTHSLERKYMFLVCNGILAFLAKSSDYFSSVSDNNCTLQPGFDDARLSLTGSTFYDHDDGEERQGKKVDLSKEDEVLKIKKQDQDQDQENGESEYLIQEDEDSDEVLKIKKDEDEEQENQDLIQEDEDSDEVLKIKKDEDEEHENEDLIQEDEGKMEKEEDEEEGSEELVSTEELNRRIEEFIRKMKEEIRIEAQQQLITV